MKLLRNAWTTLCGLLIAVVYVGAKLLISLPAVEGWASFWMSLVWWLLLAGHALCLVATVAAISACLRTCGMSWAELGWRSRLTRREGVGGGCLGAAIYASIQILSLTSGGQHQVEKVVQTLDLGKPTSWLGLFISNSILTGISEELFYRAGLTGFIFRGLGRGPVAAGVAVFASSLLFSVMHPLSGLDAYLLYGAIGVVTALVYLQSGSLGLVIIAHMVANALPMVNALYTWSRR